MKYRCVKCGREEVSPCPECGGNLIAVKNGHAEDTDKGPYESEGFPALARMEEKHPYYGMDD